MAEAATAGDPCPPLLPGLPDEIVVWEILARLPPNSLLRCRAVCRSWRSATTTHSFLLAHHARQPSLPVLCGFVKPVGHYNSILAFDHRAANSQLQLQPVARLDNDSFFCLQASCDGLLVLSAASTTNHRPCLSICNPATRQRALLLQPRDASVFSLLGMYLHRPSGEYRLLLYRTSSLGSIVVGDEPPPPEERRVGCYISAVGSDLPPRYVGGPEEASALGFDTPALVRDSLHWSPVQHQHQGESRVVVVFDTAAESFRQMRAPVVPANTKPYIFDMDGKLGVYSYDDAVKAVDVWVLPDYEAELWGWEYKCRVELPVAEIRALLGGREGQWDVSIVSADGAVLLLLSLGRWLFCVDGDGKLVDSFHRDGQKLYDFGIRLKQSFVPHAFFAALENYAVNAAPFI